MGVERKGSWFAGELQRGRGVAGSLGRGLGDLLWVLWAALAGWFGWLGSVVGSAVFDAAFPFFPLVLDLSAFFSAARYWLVKIQRLDNLQDLGLQHPPKLYIRLRLIHQRHDPHLLFLS